MMAARDLRHAAYLRDLLAGFADVGLRHDRAVTGITSDSREVQEGDLFLARNGSNTDAERYIFAAICQGAVAVAYGSEAAEIKDRGGIPLIPVPNLDAKVGIIASRFFDHPSCRMWIAGVTGTNGKTSITHYLAQALHSEGLPCGLLGTLGYGVYGALERGRHTTPDAVKVQESLAGLCGKGVHHAAMEVSSHGLHQGRVVGVEFNLALFSNLTQDHLDYHGDMQSYAEVKRSLFHSPGLQTAVINLDDPVGREILADLDSNVHPITYSLEGRPEAEIRALSVETRLDGLALDLETPQGAGRLESHLLGRFNGANLLAVLATLLSLEIPLAKALQALARVHPVPGRMERFTLPGQPIVVVDYAHTPDALEQALNSLREHCSGRLWCLFGCGGERDRGKRPRMGAIAGRLADGVILTDDNPRGEEGNQIIEEILAGLETADAATVQRDREQAITLALTYAAPDDIVLVAGKGHEDYQEVGGVRRRFSDRAMVAEILRGVE